MQSKLRIRAYNLDNILGVLTNSTHRQIACPYLLHLLELLLGRLHGELLASCEIVLIPGSALLLLLLRDVGHLLLGLSRPIARVTHLRIRRRD
jgi:hypothetical protein